jgi:hypothetical protein
LCSWLVTSDSPKFPSSFLSLVSLTIFKFKRLQAYSVIMAKVLLLQLNSLRMHLPVPLLTVPLLPSVLSPRPEGSLDFAKGNCFF